MARRTPVCRINVDELRLHRQTLRAPHHDGISTPSRRSSARSAGSIQQRIRETALKLGGGREQLQAVVGVPGASLSISIAQYLNLADWTGRQMHPNKRGKACPRLDRGSAPSDHESSTGWA